MSFSSSPREEEKSWRALRAEISLENIRDFAFRCAAFFASRCVRARFFIFAFVSCSLFAGNCGPQEFKLQRKFLGPHAALVKLHELFASTGKSEGFEKTKACCAFPKGLPKAFLAHGQIDLGAGVVASKLTSRRAGRPVFLPVLSSVCVRLCVEEKVLLASKNTGAGRTRARAWQFRESSSSKRQPVGTI